MNDASDVTMAQGARESKGGTGPVRAGGRLRYLYLTLIVLNFAMVAIRVGLYTPYFGQPNALFYFLAPAIALCIYAGVVVVVTKNPSTQRLEALRTGTPIGLITGVMWAVSIYGEDFTNLNATIGILSTAPFLLGGFFLWGLAGFLSAKRTESMQLGILASVWCGMLCVLVTLTYGFLLLYTSLPHLQQGLLNDIDWLDSGWNDLYGFTIADTFFAGFKNLVLAFVGGGIVGLIGAGLGTLAHKKSQRLRTAT